MNIREYLTLVSDNLQQVAFATHYDHNYSDDKPFLAKDVKSLRRALKNLSVIPIIKPELDALQSTPLFKDPQNKLYLSHLENEKIHDIILQIRSGLNYLLRSVESYGNPDSLITVKLPEAKTFEDMSRVCNELKKAIDVPINDLSDGSQVNILTAESGSVWLIVGLGLPTAAILIAKLYYASAVVRKKNAECKMFEAHARSLELKNDALESLVAAQKAHTSSILQSEAEAIANGVHSDTDPQIVERLKMSISSFSDLMDKGLQLLPTPGSSDEIRQLFPENTSLNLIESSIKQISKGAGDL
ncbi:hypothetical protein ABDK00_006675 [Niabella insulamsoli]|uniref:hypothetical protein n=1 Tax=Niabella insulamsoli TaxID=3144874 RepID=UPI0031FDD682